MVHRVPIDLRGLAVGEALFQQVQEQLLLMAIIVRRAGRDLARPVERQAHRFQLAAHRVDVGVSPGAGVDLTFHRGVFGGHAERVPAHRMQDVEPLGALVAGKDVAHRIVADVAHMNASRGVGKHLKHVAFGLLVVLGGPENLVFFPDMLPITFAIGGVVAFGGHGAHSFWDFELVSAVKSPKGREGQDVGAQDAYVAKT